MGLMNKILGDYRLFCELSDHMFLSDAPCWPRKRPNRCGVWYVSVQFWFNQLCRMHSLWFHWKNSTLQHIWTHCTYMYVYILSEINYYYYYYYCHFTKYRIGDGFYHAPRAGTSWLHFSLKAGRKRRRETLTSSRIQISLYKYISLM